MEKSSCFQFGRITRTSGVKGEIVIDLDVDRPGRYSAIDSFFAEINGSLVPLFVTKARLQGKQVIVQLDGFSSPSESETLVGCDAYLQLSFLPPLGKNKFYFHEIPGFGVYDETYGNIGIAEDVVERSGQPVLRVMKDNIEILLPLFQGAVKNVDREKKTILVASPPGLIDIYLGKNESEQDGEADGNDFPEEEQPR
ncbi:MAG TPA: ribosome maturation factor RimM [Bacteroidia bacterium]|nr:ribosome maturation factor RimM [Bacteroidia bacterium]